MTLTTEQFATQRRDAARSLGDVVSRAYPYPALAALAGSVETAEAQIGKLAQDLAALVEIWKSRPRRGAPPPVRLIIGSTPDARGDWRLTWNPIFDSYEDSRAFLTLQRTHFGTIRAISLERFHEVAIYLQGAHKQQAADPGVLEATRRLLQSGCLLVDLAEALLGTACEIHLSHRISVTHGGIVEERDLDAQLHEDLCRWLDHFAQNGPIPLSELRGAHESGVSTTALHRHFQEIRPDAWSLSDVTRSQRQLQRALDYNAAWWRSGPLVPLPDAKPLGKPIPENRALVQRAGRKPRLSPIAIRGIEGSSVVPVEKLREAILEKITGASGSWHFTAGDFAELVPADARMQAMRCLDRLKRSGHIVSVSKGVYRAKATPADPLQGILALTRDRGEHACPAPHGGFYTDGALRSFRYETENFDLRGEPCAGLCQAAARARDMTAFVRLAEDLLAPGHLDAGTAEALAKDHPGDLALARETTGRFA